MSKSPSALNRRLALTGELGGASAVGHLPGGAMSDRMASCAQLRPLADAAKAHETGMAGHAPGKLVLIL